MGKPRAFTTLPVRAIADTRLTALEIRCLAVIALHDGMSLERGAGAGCFARLATLAELTRTDVANFSKAQSKLIRLGYLVREAQPSDRRRFTLRVIYGDDDSWRVDQLSSREGAPEIVGELTNNQQEIVGEATNVPAEIVGDGECKNGRFPRDSGPQYIPLNGEIDFVETSEINSVETAHFEKSEVRVEDFSGEERGRKTEESSAEAGLGGKVSIEALLAQRCPSFPDLAPEAQLFRFERALREIGGDIAVIDHAERLRWERWLFGLAEDYAGETVAHRANRLMDELAEGPLDETSERRPPVDEIMLRAWLRTTADKVGYGAQTRIAQVAGLPVIAVHRFAHGKSLGDEQLDALARGLETLLPFEEAITFAAARREGREP